MSSAQATKKKTPVNESTPAIQRVPNVFDELHDILGAIQHRAFELFEQRDGEHGRDLADWLEAETELVYKTSVTIEDHADRVEISIGLGDFPVHDVSLLLANDHLAVRAETPDASDARHKWLLVRVDLPAGADPDTADAKVVSGALRVAMRRVA